MTAELGPEIPDYKREDNVDLEPSGAEVEQLVADIESDLQAELQI